MGAKNYARVKFHFERESDAERLAKLPNEFTGEDAGKAWGVTLPTAREYLSGMREAGLVERIGKTWVKQAL